MFAHDAAIAADAYCRFASLSATARPSASPWRCWHTATTSEKSAPVQGRVRPTSNVPRPRPPSLFRARRRAPRWSAIVSSLGAGPGSRLSARPSGSDGTTVLAERISQEGTSNRIRRRPSEISPSTESRLLKRRPPSGMRCPSRFPTRVTLLARIGTSCSG
jgi:hypothetical protein